jgi:glycosyltransferase involved in cell wall biosynthesis
MHVLHVITGLPTNGAQMALCKLVEQHAKEKISASVISLMKADGIIRDRIVAAGKPVEDLGLQRGHVTLRAAARLVTLTRKQPPRLIQGWEYHGSLAASIAGWSQRPLRPVIWGIRHSILDLSNEKPTTRALIRLGAPLSRTTAAIAYCSRASARQHERIGYDARKTVIIPNGFDCELFRPWPEAGWKLRKELDIPSDRIVIGHVARFDPMKDHGNLIAAVARLIAVEQDVHLVMVGPDVERGNDELTTMIRAARIENRISLLGERTDIAMLTPGFDLLALSSSTGEAFPNVLGEAMASGVPCVATDVGDCAWIIGDTGIVVPPRNPGALAVGLRRLIEMGQEARRSLGLAARARIREHFGLQEMAGGYQALYDRILASS